MHSSCKWGEWTCDRQVHGALDLRQCVQFPVLSLQSDANDFTPPIGDGYPVNAAKIDSSPISPA